MVEKIKAARQAAREAGVPDLVINGRTDALVSAANRIDVWRKPWSGQPVPGCGR